MSDAPRKPRVLIIIAYNAEKTIRSMLTSLPAALLQCDAEVLIIDDASPDRIFEQVVAAGEECSLPFKVTTFFNPLNQGYGGNQKVGYQYAINEGFDVVALAHGEGQYAPETLQSLLEPLIDRTADAVFGLRMKSWFGALKGGMPLTYVGNRILTFCQNRLLRARLSEFHSGFRLYSTAALRRVPFHLNSDDFHFDTEIIIQLLIAGQRIREIPIPAPYGDEISHVNGMKYAKDAMKASLQARLMQYGFFYSRKFDIAVEPASNRHYQSKLAHAGTQHASALALIPTGARVLDIGCGPGHVAKALADKGCKVVGLDRFPPAEAAAFERFVVHDLDAGGLPEGLGDFDYILLLDIIEHLRAPVAFLDSVHRIVAGQPQATVIATTGNIGFAPLRAMHLMGQFNYGERGILDLTHARLFTFNAFRRLFEESSFRVIELRGLPAPFLLLLGDTPVARSLARFNGFLIRLWARMFAHDMLLVARPKPAPNWLQRARTSSAERIEEVRKPEAGL